VSAPVVEIRRAIAADAAALAAFAERAFVDAYGPLNDPADVDLHVARTYGPALQAREIADADACYLLALDAEAITGYAYLHANAPPPVITAVAPWEVRRFYVDRAWHGRGVATALMQAALAMAEAGGARTVWLTTWEHSARARAFYAKCGFADAGAAPFRLGAAQQTDRLLVRRVG
jgi:GNAT superfamily N-acetyltransferase